ncbi:MAG: DUF2344 domain-containing protein [Clostridia bacterium]|nr:DUF2344 domain-containing protein [Clostridia bacterium]
MIAFKYTKTNGAEYLSHLDLLRHIERTLRRAQIPVNFSQGFNKHPRIFMNNPLGTGIKSVAEYCTVDTPFCGDFTTAFNQNSPKGVKCVEHYIVSENPNFAYTIEKCLYRVKGISTFNPQEILQKESIVLTDSRGREVDIRPRIYTLEVKEDGVYFWAGCNEKSLRPELLGEYLCAIYGGAVGEIIKLDASGNFKL